MSTVIACLVTGICAAGFVAIWFWTAYEEMSAKRNCLVDLDEQLRLHLELYEKTKDGPNIQSANEMVKISKMLCYEAGKSYNRTLGKPLNRFPALLMGFRQINEDDI